MSAAELVSHHQGKHCPQRRPSIFRRSLRMPWRRSAVPAVTAAGTATAFLSQAAPSFTPARPVFTPATARTTGEFAAVRRPVNGRPLGDQPRRTPVPFAELNRKFDDGRPAPEVLHAVLTGLRNLDVSAGLSFDCGNGLHEPLCPGRNCSCGCHR